MRVCWCIVLIVSLTSADDDTRGVAGVNRRHLLELQRAGLRHRHSERLRHTTCTSSETLPQQHVHENHAAVARAKRSIAHADDEHDVMPADHHVIAAGDGHADVTPQDAHADVTPAADNIEKSVLFDASAGVLEWRNADKLPYPAANFTVEAWIKPDGGQATGVSIVGKC